VNDGPRVAVLTPSYNQGRFIRDTLESVRRQSYANIEHIVVDGGSTDDTLRILEEYDGRVNVLSEPDRGQGDALNKAFALARGSIIGWLNADDFYLWDGVVATVVAAFEGASPRPDVLFGHAVWVDDANRVVKVSPRPPFSAARLRRFDYISQPATFFRSNGLEPPLVDPSLHHALDYHLWLRLLDESRRFARCDHYLAVMRYHEEAKTFRKRGTGWAEETEVRARVGAERRRPSEVAQDLVTMATMKASGLGAFRRSALHEARWTVPLALPPPALRPLYQAGLLGPKGTTLLLPRYFLASRRAG
jgi:glycosyltransferase involved in cell wall biosynthesis